MKARQPHIVPLSIQAMALLRELQPLTGANLFLFPGERSSDRPMSNNTLTAALRRLGYGLARLLDVSHQKLALLLTLCATAAAAVSLPSAAGSPPPPLPIVSDPVQERVQAQLMIQQAQAQARLAASQARVQAQLNANQARLEAQVAAEQAGTRAQLQAAGQHGAMSDPRGHDDRRQSCAWSAMTICA
jgi:hypothetical protein